MHWDAIIIGSGSAGCAAAYHLIRADQQVLILEAGGRDWSPFLRITATQPLATARHDWGYRSAPDPTRNGMSDHWLRGRVLGGSSSVNGTMFVRGAASDFDGWDVPGWGAADVMPAFQAMERSDQGGVTRGAGGPLHVRTVRRPHALSRAFLEASAAGGRPATNVDPAQFDYNDVSQDGAGLAQLTQRRGWRCSAADAFLKPLLGRKNVQIRYHALVDHIEFADGRAVAVHFEQTGVQKRETADRIILSAGSINSPQILMRSGVGDPEELAAHGIATQRALPAVGRNLQEHPMLVMSYRAKALTYNPTGGVTQKIAALASFIRHGEGPLSNLFEAAAFVRSSPVQPRPDLQLLFLPLGMTAAEGGGAKLADEPSASILILSSYPQSKGRIRLSSHEPKAAPIIECRLLEHQGDVDRLVNGIDVVRRIVSDPAIAPLLGDELLPGAAVETRAAREAYVRANTSISFHPIGTCRMGTDDASVVDPNLRVRGIDNLYVADASVIPHHISANINAVCMMIGYRLGEALAGTRPVGAGGGA